VTSRFRRRGLVFAVLLGLALVWSAAGTSGGSIPITLDGRIGPLHMDTSTRADVLAFGGRPALEVTARNEGGYGRYDALGYRCTSKAFKYSDPGDFCGTVFFIDIGTGRLEDFYTDDPNYSLPSGIHVGTAQALAERILGQQLYVGCDTYFFLESKTGRMTIWFRGGVYGRVDPKQGQRILRTHVGGLFLHSKQRGSGFYDCA
jgi:hypothetical protein